MESILTLMLKCLTNNISTNISSWGGGDFPDGSVGKESVYNEGDRGSIPGSGRSTGEVIGYPLQYS